MNKIFVLIFLTTALANESVIAQKKNEVEDSAKYALKIERIDQLFENAEIKYGQIIDSLEKELVHYKAKEDYFSVALEDQSNRFALIVTSLLGLLALVSYGGYKYELSRMKKDVEKQLAEQMSEFVEYKTKIKILDSSLNTSAANTFATVANNYAKENECNLALEFYLCAARDHAASVLLEMELDSNHEKIDKKTKYQFVLGSLYPATEMLNKIKADNSYKKAIKEKANFLIQSLDFLGNIDFEEIKDLVAELRIGIKNYIK